MKKEIKAYLNSEAKYLSRSVLLPESVNPKIPRLTISFSLSVFLLFLIWITVTRIDEVALAPGEIIPLDSIVKVQHLDGGAVKTIFVEDGKKVIKGDILIELDETRIKSVLDQAKSQRTSLNEKLINLNEQLVIKKTLFDKGLNSKLSYLNVEFQLKDLEGKIQENSEVIHRYSEQLNNLKIYSPINGFVHNSEVETAGQIIERGKTIMEIIPEQRKLLAEIQISPDDIGHVHEGQEVNIKFNTFDFSRYGGMTATLRKVSPTSLTTIQGKRYFQGEVPLQANFLTYGDQKLDVTPGMTLIAEVKTGRKSILEYLLKPIFMKASGAFKEK